MSAAHALPARLDTAQAGELVTLLRGADGGPVLLDASAVEHMGAFAAQTLAIAARSWARAGHDFQVTGLGQACTEQLKLMGLTPSDFSAGDDE